MLWKERPDDFSPDAKAIVVCIIHHVAWPRVVLNLLRAPDNPYYPDLLGFPCGGIEPGEKAREAVIREVAEETGIVVHPHYSGLVWVDTVFVWFPDGNEFRTNLFTLQVWERPTITLSREHVAYEWLTKQEMLTRRCIPTNDLCLDYCDYPRFAARQMRVAPSRPLLELKS